MMHDNYDPDKELIVPKDGAPKVNGLFVVYLGDGSVVFAKKEGDSYHNNEYGWYLFSDKEETIIKHIGPLPNK